MKNLEIMRKKIFELEYLLKENSDMQDHPAYREGVTFLNNYKLLFAYLEKLAEKREGKVYFSYQKERKLCSVIEYYIDNIGKLITKHNEYVKNLENLSLVLNIMAMTGKH